MTTLLTDREVSEAVATYETQRGRRITQAERASVETETRSIQRGETWLQLWFAGLTDRERRAMGMLGRRAL